MEEANNIPTHDKDTISKEEHKGLFDMISKLKLQVGRVMGGEARTVSNPTLNIGEGLVPHLLGKEYPVG